jgi:hypothetical protein
MRRIYQRVVVVALLTLSATVASAARSDDWPQWLGPTRDAHWRESGIVDSLPAEPKVLWRTPIHGGYAGPAVAGGRVYVMDYVLADGDPTPDPSRRNELKGKERVLCLDAATGRLIWEHAYDCNYAISYPSGPRCTPTVVDGKVYALGAEGNFWCLNAADGKILWSKDFKKEYRCETLLPRRR